MGGYAVYVWSSFALGMLVLLWNIAAPLFAHKNALRKAGDYHAGSNELNGENP